MLVEITSNKHWSETRDIFMGMCHEHTYIIFTEFMSYVKEVQTWR
jgi:hypothetical protein